MKKIPLFLFFVVVFSQPAPAQKRVALTIDDLPFTYTRGLTREQKHDYFIRILDTLDSRNVKVMGFTVTSTINGFALELMNEFVNRGHSIGNHTHSHRDLDDVSAEEYIEDFLICDSLLTTLFGKRPEYFRYPCLSMGDTPEKRDSVLQALRRNGYTVAPVTIDNDDWKFNKTFVDALPSGDTVFLDSVKREYISHIEERILANDSFYTKKYDRDVPLVMLLHMNYINSFVLGEIIDIFLEDGWNFIPLEEALADTVYLKYSRYSGEIVK
ncbi:polysaccharide deacetylase family protein [candidate division WOR-3 bacterium]|nr:polysaccharide deacetylase family protein [candidate division WOR-3 bacterium]